MIGRRAEEQALLQPEERHGRRRAHGYGLGQPVSASSPLGRSSASTGTPARVDGVDGRAEVVVDGAREPGAEQRVDDDVGAAKRAASNARERDARARGSRRPLAPLRL